MSGNKDFQHVHVIGRCGYGCENADSFSLAGKRMEQFSCDSGRKDAKPILVLNLANAVSPGGGVRRGAKAQEEDLCRKSSLLLSLESRNARPYYEYNKSLHTYMGSDAVMIHPQVEIIKDEKGDLLPETVVVAVMTCAAPMLRYGLEGLSQTQYETMVYDRITGMLKVAAYLGYKHLILGAFGCGAFRNNPECVARGFELAIKDFEGQFEEIVFAIYHQPNELRNFQIFAQVFEGKTIDYNLGRFIEAQDKYYDIALAEISASQKRSHWIWYIFPQLAELGYSYNSKYYGISGIEEARAYLNNPTLKKHLLEICGKLYECDGDIAVIMGNLDSLKLLSCMTLFNATDPSIEIFQKIIDKFYAGQKDRRTLKILGVE